MRIFLTFLLFVTGTLMAHAGEAITFSGKLGKMDIIVELSGPVSADRVIGRYAYKSKGVDIPLRGTVDGNTYTLIEEKPCTPEACIDGEGMPLKDPVAGADWTLEASSDGKTLKGEWKGRDKKKTFAITLNRVGSREFDSVEDSAPDALDPTYVQSGEQPSYLTPEDLPYDFLKMDAPQSLGEEIAIGTGAYKMATDPRTGMAYPVVTKLDGADIGPVNTFLAQQRLQWNLNAFSCLSKIYLGNGYFGGSAEGTTGTDGGGQVTVDYLTDRLMGITESGSFFCGGAHPFNFIIHRLVDVKTGKPMEPESLLKDWVAKDYDGNPVDPATVEDPTSIMWGPGPDLVKMVNETRKPGDATQEQDCNTPGLVASNLGLYFKDDEVIFTLKDLEHVIFACTDDLLTMKIKDARSLFKPEALPYFAAFD